MKTKVMLRCLTSLLLLCSASLFAKIVVHKADIYMPFSGQSYDVTLLVTDSCPAGENSFQIKPTADWLSGFPDFSKRTPLARWFDYSGQLNVYYYCESCRHSEDQGDATDDCSRGPLLEAHFSLNRSVQLSCAGYGTPDNADASIAGLVGWLVGNTAVPDDAASVVKIKSE